MKELVWILVVLASLVCSIAVTAGAEGLGQDTIYDKNGNRTGHVKESRLVPGQFELYDKDWNRIGHIKQNRLQPGRYDIFDQNWERKGFLEKTDAGWERQQNERR